MDKKILLKTTIYVVTLVLICYLINANRQLIINKVDYYYRKYFQKNIKQVLISNEYKKNQNYEYLKINTDTRLKNMDDIKNAIYTYLDSGWDKYIMICDADYLTCTDDVKSLAENKEYLTTISNFISPFNTFDEFNTSISKGGKIIFSKKNRYTTSEIEETNELINKIYNENYDKSKNVKENIKIFHDYIINNTKYDKDNKTGSSKLPSSTAYGVLKNGVGICSGYADTMGLILDKMHVKNYRISSATHIWNFVYVEGKWLHLDLTWDDPTTDDNTSTIIDDYFLITTDELEKLNDEEHNFDKKIYIEAK